MVAEVGRRLNNFIEKQGLRCSFIIPKGYQFYTTSPNVYYFTDGTGKAFYPKGSSIHIKIPSEPKLEGDPSQIFIKAIASCVEVPEVYENHSLWNYQEAGDLDELNEIMQKSMFVINDVWQINGLPEHVYFNNTSTHLDEVTNQIVFEPKSTKSILCSWTQQESQIFSFNAHFPFTYFSTTDKFYDIAPGLIKKQYIGQMPDMDWQNRACLQNVTHDVFGTRTFIILNSSDGIWYCWPIESPIDPSEYQNGDPSLYTRYSYQGYKANTPSKYAKAYRPVYPSWVYTVNTYHFRVFYDEEDVMDLAPRYSWSFNSSGTKAITLMIERKDTEGIFTEIDYAPAGLTQSYFDNTDPPQPPVPSFLLPTERVVDPFQIDQSKIIYNKTMPNTLQVDRLGTVELRFNIILTGENLEDYDFDVGIVSEYSPDELVLYDKGVIVGIAYAMPTDWEEIRLIKKDVLPNFCINVPSTDNILTAWIELYEHDEQKKVYDGFDGEMSIPIPCRSKITFYKDINPDYHVSFIKLFALPLSQIHGDGYTYTPDPDYLPYPPHKPVWCPDYTFETRFPYIPKSTEYSDKQYTYFATITDLDLRSLSFYYTVRLLEGQKSLVAYEYPGASPRFAYHNWDYRARKVGYSFIFGKQIDEVVVGCNNLALDWIRGWVVYAVSTFDSLPPNESKIDPDKKRNFRGIGHVVSLGKYVFNSTPAGINGFYFCSGGFPKDNFGNYSWVNGYLFGISTGLSIATVGATPWWLTGACQFMLFYGLMLAQNVDLYGSSMLEVQPSPEGLYFMMSPPPALSAITNEIVAKQFLIYVYNLYTTHEIQSRTYDFENNLVINTFHLFQEIYAENPFDLSCLNFDVDVWSTQSAPYMLRLAKNRIRANFNITTSLGSLAIPQRGGGLIYKKDYNLLYDRIDQTNLFTRQRIIRDFEWGVLTYNHAIHTHLNHSKMSEYSKILVTPDGHFSYSKRDLYEFKNTFSTFCMAYYHEVNYTIAEEDRLPFSIRETTYDSFDLSKSGIAGYVDGDIEWKLLDRIGWYYNKVWTDHLSAYNIAYNEEYIKQGKDNINYVYGLGENLDRSKYTEDDFRPSFDFTISNGMWIMRPSPLFNDEEYINTLSLTTLLPGDGIFYRDNFGPYYIDSKSEMKHIRLSPLFF